MRSLLSFLLRFTGRSGGARAAFRARDVSLSREAHDDNRTHSEPHSVAAEYLSDFVLGGIDGIITTFAVVSGVVGASLSSGVIIVLGVANLLADGISMAVGNYLGAKSEQDYYRSERERETWEVENLPDHEVQEIREIYEAKGFQGELLEQVVKHITSDKELWVDTMMKEELGIIEDRRNPYLVGSVTFVAFTVFGAVPLIAYIVSALIGFETGQAVFFVSLLSTGLALFGVGALRSQFTFESWWKSGLEILLLGGLAGAVAYFVGALLRGLVELQS